ncbi:MAG: acyclic terpene utilization AtuA family protein [Proteobacteria bacterium]|nr:acyclic terpene utilization AtuA family protein [Pseudomonadota bacterium]
MAVASNEEIRILTPSGMLGYGFPVEHVKLGLALKPHAITIDSGSTDSGPQKLGLGEMTCSRANYVKDMEVLLEAQQKAKIPLLISSAGGDGSNLHVDVFRDIMVEIARRRGWRFKLAKIYSDVDKAHIKKELKAGRIEPLGPVPQLDPREVDAATVIVAQIGAEPFNRALDESEGVDVIVSGRAYDPSPTAAMAIRAGFDPALAWHMGKIMECGALCAEPVGRSVMGWLRRDHFEIEPLNPAERCTTASVAAHTLYEKTHPFLLAGPGGTLDLSGCRYEQVSDRRVRVSGSRFTPARPYTVKLEGAKTAGYRSIFIAGARDPIFIAQIDEILARVIDITRDYYEEIPPETYRIIPHLYGKNGVMGELEPVKTPAHELCIIVEVAAATQAIATAICGKIRTSLMHAPYPGRIATAGNLASPFTPLEIPLGQACEFNVYHLMQVDSPTALFPVQHEEIA